MVVVVDLAKVPVGSNAFIVNIMLDGDNRQHVYYFEGE